MNKPDPTTKITCTSDEGIRQNLEVFNVMEEKMLSNYNTAAGSLYTLTQAECDAMVSAIHTITSKPEFSPSQVRLSACAVRDDIEKGSMQERRYNKRALLNIIETYKQTLLQIIPDDVQRIVM